MPTTQPTEGSAWERISMLSKEEARGTAASAQLGGHPHGEEALLGQGLTQVGRHPACLFRFIGSLRTRRGAISRARVIGETAVRG